MRSSKKTPLVLETPRLPAQVDVQHIKHVKAKGALLLLSAKEITKLKSILWRKPAGIYRKTELAKQGLTIPYNVIKYNSQYYVVYLGIKHSKHCGSGGFGTVKLVQQVNNGAWFAVKIMSEHHVYVEKKEKSKHSHTMESVKKTASDEYEKLSKIGQALAWFERNSPSKGYQRWILMHYLAGMDLYDFWLKFFFNAQCPLSTYLRLDILVKFCDALQALHDIGIFHHDIKCSNVIYDPMTKVLRLCDFGLSRPIPETGTIIDDANDGTLGFNAPELGSYRQYSASSEVYSLGITMGCFLDLIDDQYKFIESAQLKKDPQPLTDSEVYIQCTEYLQKATVATDPSKRATVEQVKNFLQALRDGLGEQEKVTLFDVKKYRQADSKTKEDILAELLNFDEVVFTNTQSISLLENISLQRELLDQGIIVSNWMLTTNNLSASEKKLPPTLFKFFQPAQPKPLPQSLLKQPGAKPL